MVSVIIFCILACTVYLSIALSVFTCLICSSLLMTSIAIVLTYIYRVPAIDESTLLSRLNQKLVAPVIKTSTFASRREFIDDKRNFVLHRGGIVDRPENTLEAIRLGHEQGAGAVEIDLAFTLDGVGVLLHDITLDRTTDGSGPISQMDYKSVRELDAAAKHSCRQTSGPMKIPSMKECVEECLRLDMMLYIDCKSQPERTANLILELYKEYPALYNMAIVCSFNPLIVYAVRRKDANIITGLTHRSHVLSMEGDGRIRNKQMWKRIIAPLLDIVLEWCHYNWLWFMCGNSFFIISKEGLSQYVARHWNCLGIQVVAWTVNNPMEKDYFLSTINCPIMTDAMHSTAKN